MENPNKTKPVFAHSSHEGCLREIERVLFKNSSSWRDRVLASLFDRDLASTGTSSETATLESTLCVDTVRGEPRTWLASVFAASTIRSIFETDRR